MFSEARGFFDTAERRGQARGRTGARLVRIAVTNVFPQLQVADFNWPQAESLRPLPPTHTRMNSTYRLFWLVMLSFATVGFTACRDPGVVIRIKNESRGTISNVQVVALGRAELFGEIALHGEVARTIKPTGDSSLEVIFINADGNVVRRRVDVYVSRGFSGEITIEIDATDGLNVRDGIKV